MAVRVRLGRFEFQVRMVLVLLVLFLAVLDVLNLFLLARAKDALETSERAHATARIRALADDPLTLMSLPRIVQAWGIVPPP